MLQEVQTITIRGGGGGKQAAVGKTEYCLLEREVPGGRRWVCSNSKSEAGLTRVQWRRGQR